MKMYYDIESLLLEQIICVILICKVDDEKIPLMASYVTNILEIYQHHINGCFIDDLDRYINKFYPDMVFNKDGLPSLPLGDKRPLTKVTGKYIFHFILMSAQLDDTEMVQIMEQLMIKTIGTLSQMFNIAKHEVVTDINLSMN